MNIKFNVYEIDMDNSKKKEIKDTNEINGVDLNPLLVTNKVSPLENIYYNRLFTLPKVNNMSYSEVLLICISNLYSDLVNGLSKNQRFTEEGDFDRFYIGEGRNEDGIHLELRHFLANLGSIVQYTINSSSYINGEFYEFDAITLIEKISVLKYYCMDRLYKEDIGVLKKEPSFEAISTDILKTKTEPFYIGEKLGVSIDQIIDKIDKKEIEHFNRFFYIKHECKFYFYTLSDLK